MTGSAPAARSAAASAVSRTQWRDRLRGLPTPERLARLHDHSGLPGPRATLTLLDAAADGAVARLRELARDERWPVREGGASPATDRLCAQPAAVRRAPAWRTLRQALGYCWSVAVAADPPAGLPAFRALGDRAASDPDLAWIVRTDTSKTRLAKLLV